MKNRRLIINLLVIGVALSAQFAVATATRPRGERMTKFTVRIDNISDAQGQVASDGSRWPFALSPGMFVLNASNGILFKEGKRAQNGLEAQAEDGNPEQLVKSLENMHHSASLHGIFNTPVGTMGPGPIGPGGSYEFTFSATPGMKLFMAMMFGQSNDLFYAPGEKGIALFDAKGNALRSDVTESLILWDAGTEADQELGVGPDQGPRQKSPNTGAAENGVVRRATKVRFYGKNAELFRVTITPDAGM